VKRGAGRGVRACALLACLALPLAACSEPEKIERASASQSPSGTSPAAGSTAPRSTPGTSTGSSTSKGADDPADYAVDKPGPLEKPLLTADVLITSSKPISSSVLRDVTAVKGVSAVLPMSLGSVSANGRTLSIAAADPGRFRRFTPIQSAQSDEVWDRVAGGEVAVDPALPRKLEDPKGYLRLGSEQDSPSVHIGAYAPIVKQISAVVDYKRGAQLGLPRDNALLVSTGNLTPSAVTGRIKKVLGPDTTLQTLALEFNVDVLQTAVLSGSSVPDAVGTFNYTPHANGTVTPESSWVRTYIRRENVPLLGTVTCNKGMLPQLRAALTEIVQQGLADKIHPDEYAGCYYPRFIANDPSKGLSLHSWGIAVDLNVPGNQRGTVGEMDRQVVAIFKKWGFAWGGDWNYTDPMHFEMAKVVKVR
jgi:hypothetical protein